MPRRDAARAIKARAIWRYELAAAAEDVELGGRGGPDQHHGPAPQGGGQMKGQAVSRDHGLAARDDAREGLQIMTGPAVDAAAGESQDPLVARALVAAAEKN